MDESTLMKEIKGRSFGVASQDTLLSMTGLEFLNGMMSGELPLPPVCKILNYVLTEAGDGYAVFTGHVDETSYNPLGTVHGGHIATLLDSCVGCAVCSKLQKGQSYTTQELKVNYVRALTKEVGIVKAQGRIIHAGRRQATAEGKLTDVNGKLYAHCTTTCMIL